MHWTMIEPPPAPAYVAVLDPGDEAVAQLTGFARAQDLEAAQVTAIGGFERAVVGWFDRAAGNYRRIPVPGQCEVLSLLGDIAAGADGPQIHLHAVVGLPDGTTRGGHLLEGHVWPTLEVIIREAPAHLRKTSRPDVGLALLDVSRPGGSPAPP